MHLAVGGIIQEHIDHVVEVNGGVIDGNSIHFARAEGSPGDQTPDTTQSFTPTFTHMSGRRLAWPKKIGMEGRETESLS